MDIVIDTSAILAVVGEQPEKPALIRLTRGATLLAPSSVHWEIGNAISAMFKRRAVDLEQGRQLVGAYGTIPIRLLDVPLRQAVDLASRLGIYAYDAYVIACAVNQRAPLLTLDNSLAARAIDLGLEVLDVRKS
jgi:predicted nucleic acid-binding protein